MDPEHAYLFDLHGFVVLRNVLDPSAVAALLAANQRKDRRARARCCGAIGARLPPAAARGGEESLSNASRVETAAAPYAVAPPV